MITKVVGSIKRTIVVLTASLVLLSSFLLGILFGRHQILSDLKNANPSVSEPVSADAQLMELHIFSEKLDLDIPIPALRVQIKFRTPQRVETDLSVELQFKGALKEILGEGAEATTCELVEEHFGWTVYTYGYTIGGDTLSPRLLDTIANNPYEYVSARVIY